MKIDNKYNIYNKRKDKKEENFEEIIIVEEYNIEVKKKQEKETSNNFIFIV